MKSLRLTKQKKAIIDLLSPRKDHPTAEDIYSAVRKLIPKISLATVYRNLEIMAAAGIIMKIEHAGLNRRFDPDTSAHSHFICVECGIVEDIPFNLNNESVKQIDSWIGKRKILRSRLDYYGLCGACANE